MSKNKFIYTLVCTALLFQTSLVNAEHDEYVVKNQKVWNELSSLATQGDAIALLTLGYIHEDYNHEKEAFGYYQNAAAKGNIDAKRNLGIMYATGRGGVRKDYSMAFKLIKEAADRGDAKAQSDLGTMYTFGDGVEKDYNEAVELFRKAIKQGFTVAQKVFAKALFHLSLTYDGTDFQKAQKAYDLKFEAATQGHAFAQYQMAQIFSHTYYDYVNYDNPIYVVKKNDKKANEWYQKSADNGNKYAMSYLAQKHYKQDPKKAFKINKRGATAGDTLAKYNLANMFYFGQGVEKDSVKAFKWYEEAAKEGNKDAQQKVAGMYSLGIGVKKNDEQAAKWVKVIEGNKSFSFIEFNNKVEKIEKWANDLFDNRFFVYNFTYLQTNNIPSERIRLHGQRIIKKIWIDVEVQLNKDGTIKRDNNDNISLCKIKAKSNNLLLDVDKNCFIEKDIWDRIKDYAW
jgi:TPR repeat protein